jgi:hypothetical protein
MTEGVDGALPFSAAALKGYEADYRSIDEILALGDKFPLRVAILRAVEVLRRQGRGEIHLGSSTRQVGMLRQELNSPIGEKMKTTIITEQRDGPAMLLVELEDALAALEKQKPGRDKETSKRWRAHYDYVLAMLESRYAYLNEYNLMLGKIRKDELPPLDPKQHTGWRLQTQEKMASPRDVKDKAEDAKTLFDGLIKDHPGTPWEVLAKRERRTALGLTWQPRAGKN